VYSRFIFYRRQYTARTSFDATPATGTIAFDNTDDFIPVLLPAVQVAENPQHEQNPPSNIYCIHYLNKSSLEIILYL
jgi:hypothetical protein